MLKKIWDNLEEFIIVPLIFAMSIIIFIQVIMRYVFQSSLTWSEELARYLFVWIIYLTGSKAVKDGKHLTVDILPLFLKGKAQIILHIFSTVATLAFFVALLYAGSLVLPSMMARPQFSPANHVNMIIPYLAPTVGTVLMTLRAIVIIINDVKNLKNGEVE
jgi:TRAP-type C4-dicarboxylate transport system permease small subunit